ncbi:MAG: hypothetical protein M1484_02670 [Patescibacteria group bacterium]|nr:hypothetical protein [Patescibacteria group bacterium]MCL5431985.1 hypothetical protein [Patescibacteria group bacterium]
MPANPPSPDQGHTRLAKEVLPPSGYAISPNRSRWTGPDGRGGPVVPVESQNLLVPDGVNSKAGELAQAVMTNVKTHVANLEQSGGNQGRNIPDIHAAAANEIASDVESRVVKVSRPTDQEIKTAEQTYLTRSRYI